MAIDKQLLWKKLHRFIAQQYAHADRHLLLWLCYTVLNNNPTQNCFIKGSKQNWRGLPPDKSLFYSAPGCGLPIGSLTSQIFANFYLNTFDHFIKHDLKIRYYGRFVDDFFLVHENKETLKALIPIIRGFLKSQLSLTLHPKKVYLQHYRKGVQFLGVVIKPYRITCGRRIKGNFYNAITEQNRIACVRKPTKPEQTAFFASMNSYLGILKHYNTYQLRKQILITRLSIWWWNLVYFSGGCTRLTPKQKIIR